MPLFQAGQVKISSGLAGTTLQNFERIQNININSSFPRVDVTNLGYGKPLTNRPIVNYTPTEVSFDFVKSDNSFENALGLINSTGIMAALVDGKTLGSSYAVRNMQILYAPTSSQNYNGIIDLKSGILTNYSIQGGIDTAVSASVTMKFFDRSGGINTSPRDILDYNSSIIRPENQYLTGIMFSGYGMTGVTIQSFSFGLTINRGEVYYLYNQYPNDRPLVDSNVTLQVQGFFEGINNSITGLSQFSDGSPTFGTIGLTLLPACGNSSTTYTMKNPYIGIQSIEASVGNFSTVSFSFLLPIGSNPNDTGNGSVVTIT